ncbi:hypothetical protein PVA17_22550 [Lysinibacillus sp. CNPSo 3705]|uniref:hypothetical protein n=1 Tax=Lysinibacillus sp. CNPSo 3705 TaxID=3028148 RepID=UPI0023646A2E|nr:hypothetical protein [Lysinibacillus sp. CNPSo 3705]MDD1505503.1 hypothetical protein [Lysinibacillus sp. CNPSo 3705]
MEIEQAYEVARAVVKSDRILVGTSFRGRSIYRYSPCKTSREQMETDCGLRYLFIFETSASEYEVV